MVSGREHQSTRGLVVLDEKPRAPTPEPRDQEKGTDPKTGLLNVKRLMACLLLWVARFPSCLVLALAGARAWFVVPLSGLLLCSWSCAPCGRRPENRSFPHVSTRRTFVQVSLYSSPRMCILSCIRVSSSTWLAPSPSSLSSSPSRPSSLYKRLPLRLSCLRSTSLLLQTATSTTSLWFT